MWIKQKEGHTSICQANTVNVTASVAPKVLAPPLRPALPTFMCINNVYERYA